MAQEQVQLEFREADATNDDDATTRLNMNPQIGAQQLQDV